jgi:hypothetical protein
VLARHDDSVVARAGVRRPSSAQQEGARGEPQKLGGDDIQTRFDWWRQRGEWWGSCWGGANGVGPRDGITARPSCGFASQRSRLVAASA